VKFKELHVADDIARDQRLARAVEQAIALLQTGVGPSGTVTVADWSLDDGSPQRPSLRLHLQAPEGAVEDRFTLDELAKPELMERRLSRLWSALLDARSDVLMANLHHKIQQLDEE
jgi:hypothetical protein